MPTAEGQKRTDLRTSQYIVTTPTVGSTQPTSELLMRLSIWDTGSHWSDCWKSAIAFDCNDLQKSAKLQFHSSYLSRSASELDKHLQHLQKSLCFAAWEQSPAERRTWPNHKPPFWSTLRQNSYNVYQKQMYQNIGSIQQLGPFGNHMSFAWPEQSACQQRSSIQGTLAISSRFGSPQIGWLWYQGSWEQLYPSHPNPQIFSPSDMPVWLHL